MQAYISGIQQIGIGVPDADAYFHWFRRTFGFDVKIFDDEAKATLMTRYTGGVVHSRRAILAMNMAGGGGAEIWQFTSRKTQFASEKLVWGDLGINAALIKCRNVHHFYNHIKNKVQCTTPKAGWDGTDNFTIADEFGNYFKVQSAENWFSNSHNLTGGIAGAIIGVSNMEVALPFYAKLLGLTQVLMDKTGQWDDLGDENKGKAFRRAVLSFQNPYTAPFSRLLGDFRLELIQALDIKPKKIFQDRYWGDGGYIHLCFDVPNMARLQAHLQQHHIPFTVDSGETFDMGQSGGRFAYAEDPDGTLIELVETHKVPVFKKLGWYLNLKKRKSNKPLPNWMVKLMGINKVKD